MRKRVGIVTLIVALLWPSVVQAQQPVPVYVVQQPGAAPLPSQPLVIDYAAIVQHLQALEALQQQQLAVQQQLLAEAQRQTTTVGDALMFVTKYVLPPLAAALVAYLAGKKVAAPK